MRNLLHSKPGTFKSLGMQASGNRYAGCQVAKNAPSVERNLAPSHRTIAWASSQSSLLQQQRRVAALHELMRTSLPFKS